MTKKLFLTILSIIFIFSLSSLNVRANEVEFEDKEINWTKNVLVNFYRNKDMGENHDLTPYFSKDVLRLMNYKIMHNNYKQKELDISYSKYDVIINPVEKEKWNKTKDSFSFNLQVITYFYYSDANEPSSNSIVLEITVSKDETGNFLITKCYQKLYSEVNEDEYNRLLSKNVNMDKWLDEQFEISKKYIEKTRLEKIVSDFKISSLSSVHPLNIFLKLLMID